METTYDYSKYVNETNVSLAERYDWSLSTFKKNIADIQPKLKKLRKKFRSGAKRGVRFWTCEMLKLLFDHIGFEPVEKKKKPKEKEEEKNSQDD